MVRKTIALAETVAAQRASPPESGTVDVELAPPGHPLRKLVDARYQPTKRHFKHLLAWLMHFAVPHSVDSCSALACLRYYGLCLHSGPGDQLTTADLDCCFILFRCPNTSWQLFAATDLSLPQLLMDPQTPSPSALPEQAAGCRRWLQRQRRLHHPQQSWRGFLCWRQRRTPRSSKWWQHWHPHDPRAGQRRARAGRGWQPHARRRRRRQPRARRREWRPHARRRRGGSLALGGGGGRCRHSARGKCSAGNCTRREGAATRIAPCVFGSGQAFFPGVAVAELHLSKLRKMEAGVKVEEKDVLTRIELSHGCVGNSQPLHHEQALSSAYLFSRRCWRAV